MNATRTAVAERFAEDTADHQMRVLHDDDLYRHLRFKAPDDSAYWFDLVTWPGTLTINGDCGTYVFSRDTDMFEFFRNGNRYGIKPDYWGEKLPGGRASVKRYDADHARKQVTEAIDEFEEHGGPAEAVAAARFQFETTNLEDPWDGESNTRELLEKLEQLGIVSDIWEWDLRDYEWTFLWCCHAVLLGISQYDAARTDAAVAS